MVREGLRSMLGHNGVEVVGEAANGAEALDAARLLAPDVILLDVELPDLDGLGVLQQIRALVPQTAVLIVSMHDNPALVRRAVQIGAAGYVLKGVGRRELLAAVQAVHDGESVLDPAVLRSILTEAAAGKGAARPPALVEPLTPVEQEVLALIASGLTNREIAERLRWSVSTVKKYVQRILDKLDVADRTQAAVEAVRRGLLA
jgi:DNA-binding NarL/FixJ family response regulator